MRKKVSVIIVNWNGLSHLKKCLPGLYSQNYKNIEVIIVDNASTDSSINFIKKNYPDIIIISNKENLGFADANNIGYRKTTGDYILFLNNDTEVTKNFLSELVKALEENRKIGGVQSKILLMDDSERLDSVGAYLTSTGFLYHYGIAKKDSSKYNKKIEIYSAKGACMMFKKEVIEKVLVDNEILDSRYFAYFEETDFSHRVWMTGYKILFIPTSIIYHKMGATSSKMNNSFVQYHSFKNRINSYLKNLEFLSLIKILPLHLFMCELASLAFVLKGKPAVAGAINKAIYWNFKNIVVTLKKRNYIQKNIKKTSDDKLLKKNLKKVRLSYYYYLFKGIQGYED